MGTRIHTRPERHAQEQPPRRRHDARHRCGIILGSEDEHSAPEERPVREAEDAERDHDEPLALPHRDASRGGVRSPVNSGEVRAGKGVDAREGSDQRLESRDRDGDNEGVTYVRSMRVVEEQMMDMLPAHCYCFVVNRESGFRKQTVKRTQMNV